MQCPSQAWADEPQISMRREEQADQLVEEGASVSTLKSNGRCGFQKDVENWTDRPDQSAPSEDLEQSMRGAHIEQINHETHVRERGIPDPVQTGSQLRPPES